MPSFQFSFAFPNLGQGVALRKPRELTRRTTALLLLYGLTLLLIHLGDARVLTRHEAFAAQPGREMLNSGRFADWMLPKLAGAPREAKPPGMMWLIAASIYVFRTSAAWAARMPSALAAMAVALMIAHLAARWFGDRIGRLAGLLQVSFSYIILQAKLSEADMSLVAAVCAALCVFARGAIDSPFGKETGWRARLTFWLACGAAFLLKGPIGLIFVLLTVVTFLFVRRRYGERDWQPLRWLANPLGIGCFIVLVVIWPLVAWRLDPSIVQVWHSEMAGTANGQFDSEPFYYYLGSVPVVLLPWTPLVIIGLWRGPNMELAGKLVSQADRAMLWRFLLCWFIPGVIFLSLAMKMKHHHYPMPVLPPLTIPAALGLDYYIRRQMSRPQGLVWPWFLAGCIAAGAIVYAVPGIPNDFKPPILRMIALFTLGGLVYLHFERLRRPGLMVTACFLTLWAAAVGEQTWLMPVQDDYRYQADFARAANGLVPPDVTIYMLGHREEEQEAEYAYYLRFPMQRLQSADDFKAVIAKQNSPAYAIAPAGFLSELAGVGQIQTLLQCTGLRPRESEADRFELLRVIPKDSIEPPAAAGRLRRGDR